WVSVKMKEGRAAEEVVDPKLDESVDAEEMERVVRTVLMCVKQVSNLRLSMS
ncbi:hypothetical protein KI387_022162, partial [Taxus chinensis]